MSRLLGVLSILVVSLGAQVINVPADYSTIQAGINAAENGDTVLVGPGYYTENIQIISKSIVIGSLFLISGDTSYISQTVIDGDSLGTVVRYNFVDSASILSGFTITNGASDVGGGITCAYSNPSLNNLIISGNESNYQGGGGILCISSRLKIENVQITNNISIGVQGLGGAILCKDTSYIILTNVFIQNNSANDGGGIYLLESESEIINSIISNNTSSNHGGGIYSISSGMTLVNTTVTANTTVSDGGGIYTEDSDLLILNSVLWGDSPNELYHYGIGPISDTLRILNSIVAGGEINIWSNQDGEINWQGSNLVLDPLFEDEVNGDYHLSDYSPAIGAGSIVGTPSADIDGNSRPNPPGSNPDMGAYENPRAEPLEPLQFIISHAPVQNALNVPILSDITVTFGVAMDSATINGSTYVVHGGYTGRLSGSYRYDGPTNTATFTPDSPFKVGEEVSVTLTAGILSEGGDPLPAPFSWSFTTAVLNGSGDFIESSQIEIGRGPSQITGGDWNGDGHVDLAVIHADSSIAIITNDGFGGFSHQTLNLGTETLALDRADFDGDGDLDLAVGTSENTVLILLNDGSGGFAPSSSLFVSGWPTSIATGDLDGDGAVDLVVVVEGIATLSVLINDGAGEFAHSLTPSIGANDKSLTTGDWDDDGDLDLATVELSTEAVLILLNNGTGNFTLQSTPSVNQGLSVLVSGDWDGDGDLDLVAGGTESWSNFLLFNNGAGFSTATVVEALSDTASAIAVGDWDGDGDLDLVIAAQNLGAIIPYENNGVGTFSKAVAIMIGDGPPSIATGDWDGNGSLDLATIIRPSAVSILLNSSVFSARLVLELTTEYSDTIRIPYIISNPENNPTSLLGEYSIDGGFSWQPASVAGDTANLAPENYQGILQWDSYNDLPGVDLPAVQFRITPYDQTGQGRAYTTGPFHLDNNHEPLATLVEIAGEVSGDVIISYTLADDENDTLSYAPQFSGNRGQSWQGATITGITTNIAAGSYSGTLTWHTLDDLPGHEDSLTLFRLIPSDYEPGTPDTLRLHVDNNDPPALLIGPLPSDSVISLITIPYELSDPENDTLSITADYSLDMGQTWLPSAVDISSRAIAPSEYSGSVTWLAFANGLAGQNDDVQLRLLPYDYDPGPGDTLTGLTVIYHPGDYSGDLNISTDDLAQFAAAWNATPQDLAYEIGPATGTVPGLLPQPDGVMDFEDLTVFAQMWNWSFANNGFAKSIPALAKATPGKPSVRLVQRIPADLWRWDGSIEVDVFVDDIEDLMMVDGIISHAQGNIHLQEFEDGGYLEQFFKATPLFTQISSDSSQTLFALVGLSVVEPTSVQRLPVVTLHFRPMARKSQMLVLDYSLRDLTSDPIEAGRIEIELQDLMPGKFVLHQNYPNPFNPTTTIRFELAKPVDAHLVVYDILGREVIRLRQEQLDAGYHEVIWKGRDLAGRDIASGIYIARLATPEYTKSIKMVLLK